MLETIDLRSQLNKPDYQKLMTELEVKAGILQREIAALGIPVMLLFEGWDAAGKGTLINRLLLTLDPRGFQVFPISAPNEDERLRPFLWRFWTRTPQNGRIAIFDRSWYGRVLTERVDKNIKKSDWLKAYDDINAFERQWVDHGGVLIKYFLHISKAEQKKRFQKLEKTKATAWKVNKEDWKHHRQYDRYRLAIEDMLDKTNTPQAPWTLVASHNKRFATAHMFGTFIDTCTHAIRVKNHPAPKKRAQATRTLKQIRKGKKVLPNIALDQSLERSQYKKQLSRYQKRILELEHEIYIKRIPVVLAFEGWDAAGKGGAIKRLVRAMDPRGYVVVPVAAPNSQEKQEHYLKRFWDQVPKAGHITVFDRSWYGRVMVERVEGFCSEIEWQRAFHEINEMEEAWTHYGAVVLKFFVHIDPREQLRRFREREKIAHKKWKITDEDWRNRKRWKAYESAIEEMLQRTHTASAPWHVVPSNNKYFARIDILKKFVQAVEARLKNKH